MNFDFKKGRIPSNYVLIKLDQDHQMFHNTDTGESTGIYIAPWGINQASHIALTGVVQIVPDRLTYNGYDIKSRRRDTLNTVGDQKTTADMRRGSVAYDVPMELAIGMRVYFEYHTRIDAHEQGRSFEDESGKYILVPYDALIMVFSPATDFSDVKVTDVYMLNGIVLIKPLEYATETGTDGIKGVRTEMDLFVPVQRNARFVHAGNLWYGNILSSGCLVKSYCDFDKASADGNEIGKPGQKICYDGRNQKRLEVEAHRVIFKKHTLYRIHRKDIHCWYPSGKITDLHNVKD